MAFIGIASPALWDWRDDIGLALDATPVRLSRRSPAALEAIAGPAGPAGDRARRRAVRLDIPFLTVEPGPFRCLRPGLPSRPLSLRIGGHGRAAIAAPSNSARSLALWRSLRLSARNDGRDRLPPELVRRNHVLVIDESGRASEPDLKAARTAYGERPVVILHADGAAFVSIGGREPDPLGRINPHAVFDRTAAVFAPAGSQLGREAVIAGASDREEPPPSSPARAELFRRLFLDGVRYFDPWTRLPIEFDEAATKLAWLRDRLGENDRPAVCVGVSGWKRQPVAAFLEGTDGPPRFEASPDRAAAVAARSGGRVVAWDTRMPAALPAACARAGVPLERMEDGFLRSVGLGAAFNPGASVVLDTGGIYYDPTRPSDLERILAETDFTSDLLARAAALRRSIVLLRLSKYNVGETTELDLPPGRRRVLVPGQVEDDASVQRGSPVVRTNLALLEAARGANPDAFLLFKPHPDVSTGLRQGRVDETDARRFADLVVTDAAITGLLDRVDAVETMTSLTGFEALLRGVAVATHGQPFYAGWGLTTDRHPPPRRARRLTLDELVAGALILYPRYLDPVTGLRCEPELLVGRLAEARDRAAAAPASRALARALYVRLRYALLGPVAALLRRSRGAGPHSR